jgi:SHS2 domain-containing protein
MSAGATPMTEQGTAAARRHEILPHTADAGLYAVAPDLSSAFDEIAIALAELAAEVEPGAVPAPRVERCAIDLAGVDLPALAFAWLNELIGLSDVHGALVCANVDAIEHAADGWHLTGEARFIPFDGRFVRPRVGVKSATYHRLAVEPISGGWSVTAYLDL